MANPLKGEVGFKVAGGDFVLAYDFNALCTLEEDLGVGVEEIGEKLNSVSSLRTVFRAGLEAKHGRMTDIEAGRLIHEVGVVKAGEMVVKAIQAAFPAPSAEGKAKGAAKAGTGPRP
jgi:hypothetical protein